ncbi:universal stress protein UspA [Vibrio albus]|uniref:Universal stress protein n=1 Tax=Vibrio albus TaxID=2200953 RepID=A0A2U3B872_9VIBR|nr:universal stress protein UspA [Vibrio albus]PWI32988.1 universal stress protein UspA [Vibrio albus]
MCYKHILVAVDLTEESKVLIQKAVALAKPIHADLSFIHIDVNYAEVYTGLIDINLADTQNRAIEASKQQLRELADFADYPVKHTMVGAGDLGYELKDAIKQKEVDLVICGHHQDFWSKLLSSTKQLLNSVPIDLLVVPLDKD